MMYTRAFCIDRIRIIEDSTTLSIPGRDCSTLVASRSFSDEFSVTIVTSCTLTRMVLYSANSGKRILQMHLLLTRIPVGISGSCCYNFGSVVDDIHGCKPSITYFYSLLSLPYQ